MEKICIFPGSFDPITQGHVDLVMRALPLFDQVIVAIGSNTQKSTLFSLEQRLAWIREVFADEPKVRVDQFEGLTAHYARHIGAQYLLRGLRNAADFAQPAPCDLASLKVAMTPDFGFAPTEKHIRAVFARVCKTIAPLFATADETSPDCRGTDEAFEILRAVSFLASFHDRVRDTPDKVGPNVRANVEEGLRYTALDITRALKQQTILYNNWQSFFRHYDVIVSPAVTLSPRPWTELFPAAIDGEKTRTYFHWLALAYAVTIVGHPAISIPVGLDDLGMPFGLQIVGPRGGDAKVLAVAAALEEALASNPLTARPLPDLQRLASAAPIATQPGFMGFD